MIFQELVINRKYTPVEDSFKPTLRAYIPDINKKSYPDKKRPTIIIFPGGGYGHHSFREAEPVALAFMSMGFNACIATYSVSPMEFPAALLDGCEAISIVKNHKDDWNVDVENIFLCGFSAGGHLAASLGIYYNSEILSKYYEKTILKVKGLILCYPVITSGEFAHKGSVENVIGEKLYNSTEREKYLDIVSLEKNVHKDVPSVFMWHTFADEAVSAENSLFFAMALREKGIPVEYHLFEKGIHGAALCTEETCLPDKRHLQPENQIWIKLCETWLKNQI